MNCRTRKPVLVAFAFLFALALSFGMFLPVGSGLSVTAYGDEQPVDGNTDPVEGGIIDAPSDEGAEGGDVGNNPVDLDDQEEEDGEGNNEEDDDETDGDSLFFSVTETIQTVEDMEYLAVGLDNVAADTQFASQIRSVQMPTPALYSTPIVRTAANYNVIGLGVAYDEIASTDTTLSGTGEPGSTIILTKNSRSITIMANRLGETTVLADGTWTATVTSLENVDKIYVTQVPVDPDWDSTVTVMRYRDEIDDPLYSGGTSGGSVTNGSIKTDDILTFTYTAKNITNNSWMYAPGKYSALPIEFTGNEFYEYLSATVTTSRANYPPMDPYAGPGDITMSLVTATSNKYYLPLPDGFKGLPLYGGDSATDIYDEITITIKAKVTGIPTSNTDLFKLAVSYDTPGNITLEIKVVQMNPPTPKLEKRYEIVHNNVYDECGLTGAEYPVVGEPPAHIGDYIRYYVTLTNDNDQPSVWDALKVTDELPEGLKLVANTVYLDMLDESDPTQLSSTAGDISYYTYTELDRELIITLKKAIRLESKESVELIFDAEILDTAYGGSIGENIAIGEGEGGNGEETLPVENDPTPEVPVQGGLIIEKSVSDTSVSVGEEFTYTITVENPSYSAETWSGVEVTDELDENLTYVSSTATRTQGSAGTITTSYDNGESKVTADIGTMDPGDVVTITITATAGAGAYGGTVTNTASVTGEGENTGPGDGSDSAETEVVGTPNLVVTKLVDKDGITPSVYVDDELTYTMTVVNNTTYYSVTDVTFIDTLPAGFTLKTVKLGSTELTGSQYTYNNTTRELTIPLDTMYGGSSATPAKLITLIGDVNSMAYGNSPLINRAKATGENQDATSNEPSVETVISAKHPVPEVIKTVKNVTTGDTVLDNANPPLSASVRDTLEYTITIRNASGDGLSGYYSEWYSVDFTDTIPAGLTYVPNSATATVNDEDKPVTYDAGTLSLTIPILKSTDVGAVITFQVTVDESAFGTTITNTAEAEGRNRDWSPGDPLIYDTDNEDVDVADEPVLDIKKAVYNVTVGGSNEGEEAAVGNTLRYSITLTNPIPTGRVDNTWTDVNVTDIIPAGLEFKNIVELKVNDTNPIELDTDTNKYNYYSYVDGELTVHIAEIANGETAIISFETVVLKDALSIVPDLDSGKILVKNTAVAEGTADGEEQDPLTSNEVETEITPKPIPDVSKTVDTPQEDGEYGEKYALIGDLLTYTITAKNISAAELGKASTWTNVVVVDTLPEYLELLTNSVNIDGVNATLADTSEINTFKYDDASRKLTVYVGDIAATDTENGEAIITFQARVLIGAYAGKQIDKNEVEINGDGTIPAEGESPEVNILPVPSLIITKEAAKTQSQPLSLDPPPMKVEPGEEFYYTIKVVNPALFSTDWTGVKVTDYLDDSLILQRVELGDDRLTLGTDYTLGADGLLTITKDGFVLNSGNEATITITVKAKDTAYATIIENKATVNGKYVDENGVPQEGTKDSNEVDIEVKGDPVASVGKKVENKTAKAANRAQTPARLGDTLLYTIEVDNADTGYSIWYDVVATDTLPQHMTLDESTIMVDGKVITTSADAVTGYYYTLTGRELAFYLGDMLSTAEAVKITYEATVNMENALRDTTLANHVDAVGYTDPDVQTEDTKKKDDDDASIPVGPNPFLIVKKGVSTTGPVRVDETLTYTIEIENPVEFSTPWTGVVITDEIDPGLNYVSVSAPYAAVYDSVSRELTINVGTIGIGGKVTVTITAAVNETALVKKVVNNTAVVTGTPGTGDPEDPADPAVAPEVSVQNQPIPGIEKTVSSSSVKAGNTLTYTVKVSNNSAASSVWYNVTLTDALPSGITYVSGSLKVNGQTRTASYNATSNVLSVNLGNIAQGSPVTVTYNATVNTSAATNTNLVNVAAASGYDSENGDNPRSVQDDAKVVVTPGSTGGGGGHGGGGTTPDTPTTDDDDDDGVTTATTTTDDDDDDNGGTTTTTTTDDGDDNGGTTTTITTDDDDDDGGGTTTTTTDDDDDDGGTTTTDDDDNGGGTTTTDDDDNGGDNGDNTTPPDVETTYTPVTYDLEDADGNSLGSITLVPTENDNEYTVLDENGTPLGLIIVPEGKTIEEVMLESDFLPLGTVSLTPVKPNPKTGDNGYDMSAFALALSASVVFMAGYTRRRRLSA